MRKSILAAYTPPLRNKVRKPAGFPTPFGWAYPVLFCAVFECGRRARGDWGRACEPSPVPPTPRGQPLSPLRRTAPLTQGSHKAAAAANGEETGGRCGVRRESEANLKQERFGRKSTVCFDGGRECGWRSCVSACRISRAKHRSSSKSRFGAETGEGRLPFPLPLTRRQPLSPARRRTAPLTQGSHKAAAAANGEETGGRCADGK